MSVLVQPIPDSVRLRVTGDIETTLTVLYDDDDRFLLGFSDGTLAQGTYDDRPECVREVAGMSIDGSLIEHGVGSKANV